MGCSVDQQKSKSRLIAGVLQIFLGIFAVGRFYLGDKDYAVTQIQANVVTGGLGLIWPVLDGILLLIGVTKVSDQGVTLRFL